MTWVTKFSWVARLLIAGLVGTLVLTACGGSPSTAGGGNSTAKGSQIKVGLAFDIGGRGDKAFGASAGRGMDKAKSVLGVTSKEAQAVQGEPESAKEERLRLFAANGYSPVIAVGFAYGPAMAKIAPEFPKVYFAIIDDASAVGPNIANLTFAENEGSFLVGAAAALKSRAGNIGFIGGEQVPLIGKFQAGYVAGAKAVKPNIKVQVKYLSQPPDASGFGDPAKAQTTATGMYQNGADVVYTAAGGSGIGSFIAAQKANKFAIGVDSDQAKTADPPVRPFIITSMIKKVDVAVFAFIKSVKAGKFMAGSTVYDLKKGGITYSTTGGKIDDITAKLNSYKQKIISGQIKVPTTP